MGNWELQTNRHINLFEQATAPKPKSEPLVSKKYLESHGIEGDFIPSEWGIKSRKDFRAIGRKEVLYNSKTGQSMPNPFGRPGVVGLLPTGPVDLAFETILTGMAEEDPGLAVLTGLLGGELWRTTPEKLKKFKEIYKYHRNMPRKDFQKARPIVEQLAREGEDWVHAWNMHPLSKIRGSLTNLENPLLPLSMPSGITERGVHIRVRRKTSPGMRGVAGRAWEKHPDTGLPMIEMDPKQLKRAESEKPDWWPLRRRKKSDIFYGAEDVLSAGVHEADYIARGGFPRYMARLKGEKDFKPLDFYPHNKEHQYAHIAEVFTDDISQISQALTKKAKHKFRWADRTGKPRKGARKFGLGYYSNPWEVHARIAQLRHQIGWKTFDDVPVKILGGEDKLVLPKEIKESWPYKGLKKVIKEDKIPELMIKLSGLSYDANLVDKQV